ncbi:hypothetical protein [Singulisphaera sp. GP187]|uniref:hypothetical protein n=1 Tax=Singulisphaera sp. GP187 TaxID=1882752 RepID=UPI001161162D|nr:hypothetical protein [Singulisphaera sp. GP187]
MDDYGAIRREQCDGMSIRQRGVTLSQLKDGVLDVGPGCLCGSNVFRIGRARELLAVVPERDQLVAFTVGLEPSHRVDSGGF